MKTKIQNPHSADTLYHDSECFLVQLENDDFEYHSIDSPVRESVESTSLSIYDSILYFSKGNFRLKQKATKVTVYDGHHNRSTVQKDYEYLLKNGVLCVISDDMSFLLVDGIWRLEKSSTKNLIIDLKNVVFENNPLTIGSESEKMYKIVDFDSSNYLFLKDSYIKFDKIPGFEVLNPLYFQTKIAELKYINERAKSLGEYEYMGFVGSNVNLFEYQGDKFTIETFNKINREGQ